MALHYDGEVRIFKIKCGSYDNNAYIIADPATGEGVIVDAPDEPEKVLAEAQGVQVKGILITHTHPDHLMGLEHLRAQTGAPVWVSVHDASLFNPFTQAALERPEHPFQDGEVLLVGKLSIRAIHTPGHTPGASCYLVGRHLFSGDTLFPSGPGHTTSPEDLRQSVQSITQKLFRLPSDTVVYPGHGDDTDLATAKAEYQVFASRPHPADLHGDVLWLTS